MMKKMRTFLVGFITGAMLFGSAAYAATGISVDFLPIKFVFDGVVKSLPYDQSGFIYEGRTYVPLRFVSESVGKEVSWDSATQTAYIGKQPEKPKETTAPTIEAPAFEIYRNDAEGYNLKVPVGMKFSSVSNGLGGTAMAGMSIMDNSNITFKVAKVDQLDSTDNINSISEMMVNTIKNSAGFGYISNDMTTVAGFKTIHVVYTQTVGNVSMHINEYYVATPTGVYDLLFITPQSPNAKFQAIIKLAVESFQIIK